MEYPIREILERKQDQLYSVRRDDSVAAAVKLMNQRNIGAVVVLENDALVGIFTERDVLRRVVGAGLDPAGTPVSAVMTAELVYIRPETTVGEAMVIVNAKGIRHLPVLEDGRVLGLVSIRDLINRVVDGQEHQIAELVQYISGVYRPETQLEQ